MYNKDYIVLKHLSALTEPLVCDHDLEKRDGHTALPILILSIKGMIII